MNSESVGRFDSSRDDRGERDGGHPWPDEVTELLDHLAAELALEYVRLVEQAAESECATPNSTDKERSER
jgi:hypothetical protein